MSGMRLSGSSSAPIDTPISSPVTMTDDSRLKVPAPKRKPGRPRKEESSRGKAPMDPSAPKRARGRPRKDEASVPQFEPTPPMVTYDRSYAAHLDHHHQFLIQGTRIDMLEKELLKVTEVANRQGDLIDLMAERLHNANECVKLQQEIIQDLHNEDMAIQRRIGKVEGTLKKVVDYLDFPPPAPPA